MDGPLPRGWRWVRLGEVCALNPRRPVIKRGDDDLTTFVPMSAVDGRTGAIASAQLRPYREIRKGYTYFAEGDVLFAKITPCMQNGKHAIARGLRGGFGFGTTEFHVIRPSEAVCSEWVHLFVRQPSVLQSAMVHFTGAVGQQRVPESYLANLDTPLPPLPEQQRIAAILNDQLAAVGRARAAAQAQLEAARALRAAFLARIFDGQDSRRWPRQPLGEAARIASGITLGRKPPIEDLYSVPYLRVANVKDGYLDLSDVYEIQATTDEIDNLRLEEGDILLTEGGDADKLGRGTFWEGQLPLCIHQNHIFRVRLDQSRFLPQFVSAQIGSCYGKAYFLSHAKQTTGIATINRRVLSAFPLMAPEFAEQQRVVAVINEQMAEVGHTLRAIDIQTDEINRLPAAILRQAFRGEL